MNNNELFIYLAILLSKLTVIVSRTNFGYCEDIASNKSSVILCIDVFWLSRLLFTSINTISSNLFRGIFNTSSCNICSVKPKH